jgi:tRNA(Ile2) C34 agmatinyltransferase TiaS
MNVGKTLFAQVMEFVPWKTFARIIERIRPGKSILFVGFER